ncbi:SMC family, C-terminal domain containing protein [Trichomonas vaginalis G3]|uniref:Structural maintenance of chromosomes protein n=1 Tax=Trichomonas vaginalis (strain ATCC PRA-98 / G3) TaxID=412133 RepID=A2DUX0_TRIV3|nr:chromosome condensation [Trichomonas vaginalis G3]EAY15855.1 SMC family, C-terminal domain containing protein [Trichomonas vaginalis G3]KAI5524976.1 chromosome condensation [Trichomonas vaginalis G3]|eukprot:XP_001328078.1 SMC family, C-terminal domain containing protein [Trichomonas vaginalis G3]
MSERLIVTQIVLENFKSYYGRQIVGPFNNQLTCIVGPNGSGKSNLIDALLFVFGFRAKRMRHSKLTGLIYNGPDHPNISYARVEVHFAKAINNEEIAGSSFLISRQVEKSGESNYYLNNKKSSFTEITEYLKHEKLDFEHNRFLILQGEVQAISQMKPKSSPNGPTGFLEYIEDIIGSDKYIEPIAECESRLEEANGERSLTLDRLRMAERERDALKEAKDEADLYLQLKQKIKVLEAHSYFSNKNKIEEMIKEKEQEMTSKKTELDEKENQLKELDSKFNGEKSDKKRLETELNNAKAQLSKESSILSNLNSERNKSKMEISHINSLISKTEDEKKKAETTLSAMDTIIENESNIKTQNEQELKDNKIKLDEEKIKLQKLSDEARQESLSFNEELENLRKQNSVKNEEYLELQKTMSIAESQVYSMKKASIDHDGNLKKAQELFVELQNSKEKIEAELQQKIVDNDERVKVKENLTLRLNELQNDIESAADNRRRSGNAYADAQRLMKKNASSNEALDAIMSLNIPGVYGKLAKLGEIDRKYNAAMTAAAGNKLKYIVVDNMDIAQQCLAEIKRRRLGRVTFISLDKVSVPEDIDIPAGSKRIIDKVRMNDPKFFPAFFFAVKNTLVADDIEIAKKLAYNSEQRQRVVTLQGQLIEPAGTMSGGGTRQKEGGMDLISERELQELAEESKKYDEIYRSMRSEIEEKRIKLNEIQKLNVEFEIQKLQMDKENIETRLTDVQKTISDLENEELIDNSEKINELEKVIEEKKPLIDHLRQEIDSLSCKIREIEKTVFDLLRNKTSDQERIIKELENKISENRRLLAKSSAKVQSSIKMKENAENTIKECESNIEKHKERLSENEQKSIELEKRYEEQKKIKEESEADVSLKEENLKKYIEESTEYRRQRSEITVSIDSLKIYYETAQNALRDLSRQYEYYSQKLSKSGVTDESFDKNLSETDIEIEKENIKQRVGKMDPNLSVIEEYAAKDAIVKECLEIFKNAAEQRNNIAEELAKVKKARLDMFLHGFAEIQTSLRETYQRIALGGDAMIEIVDSLDPFGQGIVFSVRPPGKSWKPIINLSGGEKTLASLSLIFALHNFKPTPFYIMDEIDAALDFRNVSIIANFLKERTADAQFIVVTLRNNMFEIADRLVGIFKVRDCTSTISLEPSLFSNSGITV